jgi:hypothetical protein
LKSRDEAAENWDRLSEEDGAADRVVISQARLAGTRIEEVAKKPPPTMKLSGPSILGGCGA